MAAESNKDLIRAIQTPIYLVAILWIVHLFKVLSGSRFSSFALHPRDMDGLVGVFTSPFVHGDFSHLTSNSVPLFVLTLMITIFYRKFAFQSIFLIYVLTGLTVWAFARDNVAHIGASGVVYGLVSFVFWSGIFRRNVKSIVLALVVTTLYSGLFLGILPNQQGISWESHLFGGLVGILVAYWFKDKIDKDEDEGFGPEEKDYFLPRDAFEKTRAQRAAELRGWENTNYT